MPIYDNNFINFFFCVQAILNLSDSGSLVKAGSIVIGGAVHALFGCWNGQLLMDESMNLNKSV